MCRHDLVRPQIYMYFPTFYTFHPSTDSAYSDVMTDCLAQQSVIPRLTLLVNVYKVRVVFIQRHKEEGS